MGLGMLRGDTLMKAYDFLLSIAAQLGDGNPARPFRRYPLRDLAVYLSEGMCFVASHRPDLFTDLVVMKLATGVHQDARCCGCANVIGVLAQIDEDGNTVKDLGAVGSSSARTSRWYRAPCRVTAAGDEVPAIQGITIEPGMNGVFAVDPPVPPGADMWVKLKCVTAPREITEADIMAGASLLQCRFLPALRSYVLYRALMGDRHAVGSANEAQNELKNAYTYLGIQIKAEERQENE